MTKFNRTTTRPSGTSTITSSPTPTDVTFEGAPGYSRDHKSELFLLAVANMVGEQTFYETADQRDNRYTQLVRHNATTDPEWTSQFLRWLRNDANLRSAAIAGALEAASAMLDANITGSRQVIANVLQRADEPGEALAYWTSRYGRRLPKPVKRGVADAVARLYTERSLLKYDTASRGFRFGDVIDLVHPTASTPQQGDLYRHALDRRHQRDNPIPDSLTMLRSNADLRATSDPAALLDAERLRAAGMTWEDALSLAGPKVNKARLWEAIIPSMGLMALARNLRNFDQAGVSDEVAAQVAARFADPAQVAKSRMFPFRWLAAYRNAPSLRWGHALDKALTASLANVPALPGRTLILTDVSGSMSDRMSDRSELNRADAAGVFAAGLALRAESPTLVWFNNSSGRVEVPRGGSLLKLVEAIPRPGGGTYTAAAAQRWYAGHDRVVIVTDEQASLAYGGDPSEQVPAHVPLYTWNLAGYQHGHARSGAHNRHTFGGLTDAAFRTIPLLEAGYSVSWPWSE